MKRLFILIGALFLTYNAHAKDAEPLVEDQALEAQVYQITSELRCLVCQNQTIADSHADLAIDLKNQVREQLKNGATPDQIREYMVKRYGDFVLYNPPFKATTLVLWLGPFILLVFGAGVLYYTLKKRNRLLADAANETKPA